MRVLIGLLLSSAAWGYNYHVSWNPVTLDTEGNPIEIASYRVEWGWCAPGSQKQSVTVTSTDAYVNTPTDSYCWRVYAKGVNGSEGQASTVVVFHEDTDTDGDGFVDYLDNCPIAYNPSQVDSDGDGVGNLCDGDLNNDGVVNAQDYVLFRLQLGQPSNPPLYNKADFNANGAVNAQDVILFRKLLGQ